MTQLSRSVDQVSEAMGNSAALQPLNIAKRWRKESGASQVDTSDIVYRDMGYGWLWSTNSCDVHNCCETVYQPTYSVASGRTPGRDCEAMATTDGRTGSWERPGGSLAMIMCYDVRQQGVYPLVQGSIRPKNDGFEQRSTIRGYKIHQPFFHWEATEC